MNRLMRSRVKVVAALALVATALVACGDDGGGGDGGSSGGDSGGPVPGVDADAKKVTIGGWRLASGAYASQNQTTQAVEACLMAANDAGGVNGWTFEYVANDTAGDPTRALQEVRSLVEGDKVFALVWGPGSPSNQAVLPYVEQSGIPYHPGMSGDPFVDKFYANVYSTIPPYSYQAMHLAKYAVEELGAQRVGLLYQNDDVGQSSHEVMADYVASLGAELVADVPHTGADTDYTPMGRVLADADPDAVIAWGYPTGLVKGKAATMAAGVDVPWLGAYYNASDDVIKLDPKTLDGTYFNYYLEPFFSDSPEIKEFQDAMAKYFPDVAPSGLPLNGYAACQVFLAGFEAMTADGAEPTREGYMEALDSMGAGPIGVIPNAEYTSEVHAGPNQSFVIQWKDNEWNVVQEATDMPTGAE